MDAWLSSRSPKGLSRTEQGISIPLTHAHADRDPVRALPAGARLTKDGVDAWLDKAKLLPGQDWELEIRKAVREADVVVVCLSKQFNQAGFRQKEVRWALDTAMEQPEGEIFIIPARLEECDNLESLRKWHWVDLFEKDGYEMLMRALKIRADKIDVTLQINRSQSPNTDNNFEVVINIMLSMEDCRDYLKKFITENIPHPQTDKEFYFLNCIFVRDEWQLSLYWSEAEDPKVKIDHTENIGDFYISRINRSRSKLTIKHDNIKNELKELVALLVQSLKVDSLTIGVVRGILDSG